MRKMLSGNVFVVILLSILVLLSGCGTSNPATGGGGSMRPYVLMGGNTNMALNLMGMVSSFTGTASTAMAAGAVDGASTTASFSTPVNITTDGTNLYVADWGNNKIRKMNIATGVVSILAGTGAAGAADGPGATATFNKLQGITTDGVNLYVAEQGNNKIRKIVIATGDVSSITGTASTAMAAGAVDGPGATATFNQPFAITTDGTNLYVADTFNYKIRKIVIATGVVSTFAGTGTIGAVDGASSTATFNGAGGITTDGTSVYLADTLGNTIRKIVIATGVVSTLAGTGVASATDGAGTTATFNSPYALSTDGTNLYVADWGNNKIRKIVIATGMVSSLTGTANTTMVAGAVDGASSTATFSTPRGITTDGISLYISEAGNNKIRKIQ